MKWCILILSVLSGCARFRGEAKYPDGTVLKIEAQRFLWVTPDLEFSAKDASGTEVKLNAKQSVLTPEIVKAAK